MTTTICCHRTIIIIFTIILSSQPYVNSIGSASTAAIVYKTSTVCGIVAGESIQRIECYQNGNTIRVLPNVSFQAISGGQNFFCGLRSGGFSLHCWDTSDLKNFSFEPKRLYHSKAFPLADVSVGDDQVCAREVNSGVVKCWRGGSNGNLFSVSSSGEDLKFSTITSGRGFTCGILRHNSQLFCWGDGGIADEIQRGFKNLSVVSLVAGESHACGLTRSGVLVCKGSNDSGQLNVPFSSAFEFSGGLALGANFTCAIRQANGLVACWGGTNRFEFDSDITLNVSFESIVAGLDLVCGLRTDNLSVTCWGLGWSKKLPPALGKIIPGPCVESSCSICGMYLDSKSLCAGSGNICKPCQTELPLAVPLPPFKRPPSPDLQPSSSPEKDDTKFSLASVVVGSAGCFAGICAVGYCFWTCFLHKRSSSVQPSSASTTSADSNLDSASMANDGSNLPPLRSMSSRHQSSRTFGRQRSGSSSFSINAEIFTLAELATATSNFSLNNKIGIGSFGTVYIGKLVDGREVAIKRGENRTKKFQEKESAFDSEIALLSRLHHKHLVGLVGFCLERDERLLVYEYMSNGSLHDHLHNKSNTEKNRSIVNSWRLRIRIALDAARGIDYLHNYAVPSIIHRDIKSSNILLDANWTARVSDFGLSLLGSESDQEFFSTKTAGTVGYIDPEYYVMKVLTAKTDIYGFGVVLLELLTGKKAVFKNEDGSGPLDVVEYAVPQMLAGQLRSVLDKRVGPPESKEAEAVELLATTAIHCVNLEGKERPNITDIVANLERAQSTCEDCDDSLSARTFSSRY